MYSNVFAYKKRRQSFHRGKFKEKKGGVSRVSVDALIEEDKWQTNTTHLMYMFICMFYRYRPTVSHIKTSYFPRDVRCVAEVSAGSRKRLGRGRKRSRQECQFKSKQERNWQICKKKLQSATRIRIFCFQLALKQPQQEYDGNSYCDLLE